MATEPVYLLRIDRESGARKGINGREVTTTTKYLKAPCIGLIQKSVSFSLQDKQNEIRQDFQVWDSCKISTWPAKPQVLGDHVRKYTTEWSIPGINNREHTKSWSVSFMDNRNGKRRSNTHRTELKSRGPFESEILNVLRRDWVNSVVETWVNESLSYLEFYIKRKTPSYRFTVTKWVSIPGDWPKPRDKTIVCRYVIRDEPEDSNWNCKFTANAVFRWWYILTQKGCVTNTHMAVNKIQYCDNTRVVLK